MAADSKFLSALLSVASVFIRGGLVVKVITKMAAKLTGLALEKYDAIREECKGYHLQYRAARTVADLTDAGRQNPGGDIRIYNERTGKHYCPTRGDGTGKYSTANQLC